MKYSGQEGTKPFSLLVDIGSGVFSSRVKSEDSHNAQQVSKIGRTQKRNSYYLNVEILQSNPTGCKYVAEGHSGNTQVQLYHNLREAGLGYGTRKVNNLPMLSSQYKPLLTEGRWEEEQDRVSGPAQWSGLPGWAAQKPWMASQELDALSYQRW